MNFNKRQLVDLLERLNLKRENLTVLLEYIERKDEDGNFYLIDTPKKFIEQLIADIKDANRWGKHPSTPVRGKQRYKKKAGQLVSALKELSEHYKSSRLGFGAGSFQ